jgi:hypothetical protein
VVVSADLFDPLYLADFWFPIRDLKYGVAG